MCEVDGDAGVKRELFVSTHFLALIIGQGLRDLPRQRSERFRIGVPHRCRVFRVERDQNGIACGAFHHGAEHGALLLPKNEVSFPVAGHRAGRDLGGTLGHRRHVWDLATSIGSPRPRPACLARLRSAASSALRRVPRGSGTYSAA